MQKEQNLSQKDVISPIKARLQEFFKVEGLNNSRFEKQCGLYNGFVKDLDQQIRFESLTKIAPYAPPQKAVDIVLWPFSYPKGERFGEKAKAGR